MSEKMAIFVTETNHNLARRRHLGTFVLLYSSIIAKTFRPGYHAALQITYMAINKLKTILVSLCAFAVPAFASAAADDDNNGREVDEIDNFDFLYSNDGQDIENYDAASMENLMDEAFSLLGTRYRSGASGPGGFDCSGFTSYLYAHMGIDLNRSSRGQYTQGKAVSTDNLQMGDLVFFTSPRSGKSIGHVGIVVDYDPMKGDFSFIHASSSDGVTVTKSTDPFFSRRYVGARRISK